jgi:riboflavin kinase/FMN adenylyltransferase
MKIFEGVSSLKRINNAVLTQGTFDGVHIGHKGILLHVIKEAKRLEGESVMITFYPHPRLILQPDDNNLKLLTTLAEKEQLLREIGLDNLIVLPFNQEVSQLSPLQYIRDLIVAKIHPKKIIVGYDHRFGRNREGSIEDLEKFGETFGFEVEQISAQTVKEITVSSTKIRTALASGNIALANDYLGYSYTFTGTVEHGMQLGRKIGYKTANIKVNDPMKRLPGNGIFAAIGYINGQSYKGMLSIGTNPTIENKGNSIEIHFFDFERDIYNQKLKIELVKKIRDEEKFSGLDGLVQQLKKDEVVCREILKT